MMEPRSKAPVWAVLLVACFVVAGCGGEKKSDDVPALRSAAGQDQPPPATPQQQPGRPAPAQEGSPQQPAAQQPTGERAPAPRPPSAPAAPKPDPSRESTQARSATPPPANVPKPEPKTEARPEPARPTPQPEASQADPTPQAKPAAAMAAMKDVIVMTGAPLGAVRLEHKAHAQRAGNTCTSCHHPSRPEKPLASPQQACSDCHTKTAAPPMKTKYQAAFHNPTAQSGTCITCHKTENAKGRKAPLKCTECHKKENS